MSFVQVIPEVVAQTAGNLANIGSALNTANIVAAIPTTTVAAPAADEVSTAIAALLGAHAEQYQTLSRQAATVHSEFVNALQAGAASYARTEAANAQQTLLHAATQALLGPQSTSVSAAAAAPVVRPNPAPYATTYLAIFALIIYVYNAIASQILSYLQQLSQSL